MKQQYQDMEKNIKSELDGFYVNIRDYELEVKTKKIDKADLNPIDPSLQWIADVGSYLYVYKRTSKQFE